MKPCTKGEDSAADTWVVQLSTAIITMIISLRSLTV